MALNLDPCFEYPAYERAQGSFSAKGAFILSKLAEHNAAKLETVVDDLYRSERPDPQDNTKFQS